MDSTKFKNFFFKKKYFLPNDMITKIDIRKIEYQPKYLFDIAITS